MKIKNKCVPVWYVTLATDVDNSDDVNPELEWTKTAHQEFCFREEHLKISKISESIL